MHSHTYLTSKETEAYLAAGIENNKFAIVVSGTPFLSVFVFSVMNQEILKGAVGIAVLVAVSCLFLTLVYSMARLVFLHRHRAIVLNQIAIGEVKNIEISRPIWVLSILPGIALFVGYSVALCTLFMLFFGGGLKA